MPSEHILNLSLGVSNVINGTRWEIKGSLWSQAQLNCYSDSENDDEIILDSDSEQNKDLPNQELLKPIRKQKTHPEVMKKTIAK